MAFVKGLKKSTDKGVAHNLAVFGVPHIKHAGLMKRAKVLTTKAREDLPKSELANPKKEGEESGSYPIPDRKHAANALSRVAQFGSPAMKAKVRAKVHKEYPDMGKKKE